MIQGYHGTENLHTEQVASRLNWPCVRVNLDSHISRIDLIGKDAIVIKDGKQITEFKKEFCLGLCKPKFFSFDEYDAGRPDVMFVIQRILKAMETTLDKNKVINQNKFFRMFATTNTVGQEILRVFIMEPNKLIRAKWIVGILLLH